MAERREEIEFRTPFRPPETGVLPCCGWTDGVHPSLGKGGEGLSRSRREGLRWSHRGGRQKVLEEGKMSWIFFSRQGVLSGRTGVPFRGRLENPSPRPGFVVDTHRRFEVDRHGRRRDSKFLFKPVSQKSMNTQKSENTFFPGTKSYSQACMGTTFLSSTHSFPWLDTPFDTLQSATPSSGFNASIHPFHQFQRP